MSELSSHDIAFIERLLDKHGVNELLYAVELACLNKADAINTTTFGVLDSPKKWINASNKINYIRGKIGEL